MNKVDKINVRQLIHLLIEYDMDSEILIRDSKGNKLKDVVISVKESDGLGCLFG